LIVTEQRCFSGPNKKMIPSNDVESTNASGDEGSATTSVTSIATSTKSQVATRCVISGIVTRIDLLDFVSKGE
jgi:hypothetical protein